MQRIVNKIIIHCSATDDPREDSVKAIKHLHTSSGMVKWNYEVFDKKYKFRDIGYHFYIDRHGETHSGRDISKAGAHCKGENSNSVGICLFGVNPTLASVIGFKRTINLVFSIINKTVPIYTHRCFPSAIAQGKRCPNLEIEAVNKILDPFVVLDKYDA